MAVNQGVVASSVLFLLLSLGFYYFNRHDSSSDYIMDVPREYISNRSYKEIADHREPIILTNTLADLWPARKHFSSKFLAERLTSVMAHKQETKRNFVTFHDGKPLEPLVNENWDDFNIKVNVTLPNLLQWDNADKHRMKGPYLYFSQEITSLRTVFPDIVGFVQPINDLILSDDNVQVNLWIGREGIITHTHYDCTYNFFVQLQGRKRFTLIPPNLTDAMYLYPCLHPHYGHSQVDILSPDYERYPSFERVRRVVAEVGPGDMLVVPPFWYHHVETLAESVSVNVWSDAPEYALVNTIYAQPIPFEEDWSWAELLKATRIYIDMLLESVGIDSTATFLLQLLKQRYEPLVQSGNVEVEESALKTVSELCSAIDWTSTRAHYEPLLKSGLTGIQSLFLDIPVRATMKVCLGNFVEHLVYSVVGLEYVYPFLLKCVSYV